MKHIGKYSLLTLFATILLSLFLHKDYISLDVQGIHSWRQSQTMWNVRNFVRHDANILNPRVSHYNQEKSNIYRYEFPLMQWTIAMVQKIGGEKIEIARLLIFLIGVFSVLGIYFLTLTLFKDYITSFVTAFLFQFSPVFFYYTINPIPDNLSLAAAIWYLYFIINHDKNKKLFYLIMASFCLLIAVLAKLPFLMFSVVSLFFLAKNFRKVNPSVAKLTTYAATQFVIILPGILWYLWVMSSWEGNPVLAGVFESQLGIREYLSIAYYHANTMFPMILLYPPVWLLFLVGIYALFTKKYQMNWVLSLVGITFLYLVLQFNTIHKVHDYYMMPFLPWLFVIVALGVHKLRDLKKNNKIALYILIFICFVSPFYSYNYTSTFWSLDKTYFNKDVFNYRQQLKSIVPNDAKCIMLNDNSYFIFSYQVDKMGYSFNNDYLPVHWIEDMIKNYNINYMYSDSEKINNDPEVQEFIDELLLEAGSVKVFKLKMKE